MGATSAKAEAGMASLVSTRAPVMGATICFQFSRPDASFQLAPP